MGNDKKILPLPGLVCSLLSPKVTEIIVHSIIPAYCMGQFKQFSYTNFNVYLPVMVLMWWYIIETHALSQTCKKEELIKDEIVALPWIELGQYNVLSTEACKFMGEERGSSLFSFDLQPLSKFTTKGQLILKGFFVCFSILPKNEPKISAPVG